MTKDKHTLFHSLHNALSNVDLNDAIKVFDKRGANIIDDKEIKPNTNIEKVFSGRGHVILFHRYPSQSIGHWYLLLRDPDKNVMFFDSLGQKPEYYNKNILPFLKHNKMKNLIVNSKKYQGSSSVCGRYCLVFCVLNKLGLDANEMLNFLDKQKKKYGTYDKAILNLTKIK